MDRLDFRELYFTENKVEDLLKEVASHLEEIASAYHWESKAGSLITEIKSYLVSNKVPHRCPGIRDTENASHVLSHAFKDDNSLDGYHYINYEGAILKIHYCPWCGMEL